MSILNYKQNVNYCLRGVLIPFNYGIIFNFTSSESFGSNILFVPTSVKIVQTRTTISLSFFSYAGTNTGSKNITPHR